MSDVTHLLIHTVNLERVNHADTADEGRFTEVPQLTASGIAFRISGLSSRERRAAEKEDIEATHNGYGEPDLDIRYHDIIVRGAQRYRVVGDIQPSKPHHRKVLLQEWKTGA